MSRSLLKILNNLSGVSGCEEAIRYEILRQLEGHCIYRVDALGNILAFKKGRQPAPQTRLFTTHIDEVGLMITYIEENGLLRCAAVGTIKPQVLTGKTVFIRDLPAVIGTKAMHHKTPEQRGLAAEISEMYLDIGALNRQDAAADVSLGERAVFDAPFLAFGEGRFLGKALDSRAGASLLIQLIQSEIEYDTHFAFTVQGNTGAAGARTAGTQIQPELAIVISAVGVGPAPGPLTSCLLGEGPFLPFRDKATIYDFNRCQEAVALAKDHSIPCQTGQNLAADPTADVLQTCGNGAQILSVGLPCRDPHSPGCVMQSSDLDDTLKLLTVLASHPFL